MAPTEENHHPEYTSVCLLVTASWADLSTSCLEVFQVAQNSFQDHKLIFIHKDYDQDFNEQERDLQHIKAAPLWRLTLNEKIVFEQYGGLLTVAQLKAFIHSYLL